MPRPRILVVDDNRDAADLLVHFFVQRRYRTAWAYCGLTGLALAKATKPDLTILNLMMPGMDGLSVLRELRADPATAGLKVIMTSGYAGIQELAPLAGAQDFVLTPFHFPELGAKVERVLAS